MQVTLLHLSRRAESPADLPRAVPAAGLSAEVSGTSGAAKFAVLILAYAADKFHQIFRGHFRRFL